ncbi:MAG: transcriptional regulator GcvA [Proteobacteria bacterium]|nr:transcriptional regulator GcvA [Pseudomonadota bacterium]
MARRIYPLNSLRAFESSARHLSFVKAAAELHVTPAAISHQVKKLEEYLGIQLFRRLPRGLLLAETGQVLLSELREVFLRLDTAMERVLQSDSQGALTISMAPMFAVKWLVPRLQRFGDLYPDIDLRISSSLGLIDFQRDDFDAAVRLGYGQYPGLEAVKLFDESVTPMCSPRLLEGRHTLYSPDDLQGHVLLHDDSMAFDPAAPNWSTWLDAAGATQVAASRGPHFSQPDHALQAAIDGVGVVLGWRYLAAEDIAAGRLVQAFSLALPLGSSFYLVYPDAHRARPKIVAFQDWLMVETKVSHINGIDKATTQLKQN